MPRCDRTKQGNPIVEGQWKKPKFKETIYDLEMISDEVFIERGLRHWRTGNEFYRKR